MMMRVHKEFTPPVENLLLLLPLFFLLILSATAVKAHGARIEYSTDMAVEIKAAFDSGEAMAGAQVTVYAPDDLSTPWLSGTTDEEGRFVFVPDVTIAGTWDVQVRQAGHGDIVHIPIGEGTSASGSSGFTPLQLVLMGACVIWGFVGTALYFSGKKA